MEEFSVYSTETLSREWAVFKYKICFLQFSKQCTLSARNWWKQSSLHWSFTSSRPFCRHPTALPLTLISSQLQSWEGRGAFNFTSKKLFQDSVLIGWRNQQNSGLSFLSSYPLPYPFIFPSVPVFVPLLLSYHCIYCELHCLTQNCICQCFKNLMSTL